MKLKLKLLCERNGISDFDIAWEWKWEAAVLGKATTVNLQASVELRPASESRSSLVSPRWD